MVGRRIVGAAVAAGLVLVAATAATPAAALSCAWVEADPRAVAEGAEHQDGAMPLREVYDGVLLGTVVATRPAAGPSVFDRIAASLGMADPDAGRHEEGRTETLFEVTGTLGQPLASPVMVVWPDSHWGESPFVVGEHYFVPYSAFDGYLTVGPCTPLQPFDRADVPALIATAQQHAWGDQATLGGGQAGQEFASWGSPGSIALPWVAGGSAIALIVIAALVVAWRRGRRDVRTSAE